MSPRAGFVTRRAGTQRLRIRNTTVAANAIGCGVAGYVAYRFTGALDVHLREVAITGFCGGLTTFSSAFAVPAILQREHHWGYAATLIVTTPLLCAGLFVAGMSLAH